jgi:hypothetical protein
VPKHTQNGNKSKITINATKNAPKILNLWSAIIMIVLYYSFKEGYTYDLASFSFFILKELPFQNNFVCKSSKTFNASST